MDHLDQLESISIYILREAYANFKSLGMLWSIGKDSTVLLWLTRKAFFGHVPFPLIHIDTTYKIPEMTAYRDRLTVRWRLKMIYGINEDALQNKQTYPDGKVDRIACCRLLKTEALKSTLNGKGPRYLFNHDKGKYELDRSHEPFTGIIAGVRADEEGSRSKERYFSPRDQENLWDLGDATSGDPERVQNRLCAGNPCPHPPAARLDRTKYLGIYRAGEDPYRLPVL